MTVSTVRGASTVVPRPDQANPIETHRQWVKVSDVLVILGAIVVTIAIGGGAGAPFAYQRPLELLALALALIWAFMLWQRQSHAQGVLGQGVAEYQRVLVASGWTVVLVAAVSLFAGIHQARWFLLTAMTIGTAGLLMSRHLLRLHLHHVMAAGHPLQRVFVIAAPNRAREICDALAGKDHRYRQVGVWHLQGADDPEPQVIIDQACKSKADTILYAPIGTDHTQWTRRLGWAMENTNLSLLVSPSLVEVAGPRLSVEPVEGLAFVRVDMPRFTGPARVTKRALDIVGASIGLLLLGPPMLLIGFLIRRDSPGPAVFKQVRAGARSETFLCWKYRTMYSGADAQRDALRAAAEAEAAAAGAAGGSATFKMAADPRITRLGHWLRKYSVDELPQLVNVLKGDMSLVGPRPHPLDDVERYDDVATRRLLTKPGMTGLWQVSGRSDLKWDQAVRLDLHYVENWTLATDLLILLRTVKVVLAGSGAY